MADKNVRPTGALPVECVGDAMKVTSIKQPQPPMDPAQKELFKTAQKWVGQTFFGTILKQMHNSPFKSELWSGGRGGEAFSSLYDQHLAERMARGAGRGLSNAIVKHIQRSAAPEGEKLAPSRFSSVSQVK